MTERIKRMVAVAFVVASVPVFLLHGKFMNTITSEPETFPSQEADKMAKELHALRQRMSHLTAASASSGQSRRLALDAGAHEPRRAPPAEPPEQPRAGGPGAGDAPPRGLSSSAPTLQRRAVFTRPQLPFGWDAANNDGALLYGVEYENTGAIDLNHDHDAACAVCQWQRGGSIYVEWGNGESRHNPSTPKTCGNPAHEMIYTGLIMSERYTHWKGESICVDLERAYHGESSVSDDNHNGGLLYTTEMELGSADEYAYPHNRELGCTVCGIPAKNVDPDGVVTITPESETTVFTVWGKRQCPFTAELVYEGFMAGAHHNHGGSGANFICMTTSNPNPPSGYSDGNQDGSLLYGTEYQNTGALDANHDGDAACAVCRKRSKHRDVFVQWGRSTSCSNSLPTVYKGYIMANHYTQHRSTRVCVDTARETHAQSSWHDNNGALLYTTEFEVPVSGVSANHEVGCSACAGNVGKSVFTRWGSRGCPTGSAKLYEGTMMSEHYSHRGGGANTICMHPQVQIPSGSSSGNQNGALLYNMEYENTGAIDANHDHEAACVVCELDHWESVYTQWGRSTTCTNNHITLYTGFIMAERYTHHKGEFICVDSERKVTPNSNGGNHNGGLLYTTEMEQGASDEEKYPHNVEVGCSVCVAQAQSQEVPFVRQTYIGSDGETYYRNAIHGEWVKIASMNIGQDVTVSYGYTSSSGTSSSEAETQSSAQSRAVDASMCTSASFEVSASIKVKTPAASVGYKFASSWGSSACSSETDAESSSVARATTQGTSWDQSVTETRSFSLSIPSQLPAGVPEAEAISTRGVDVWQWQWNIIEAAHEGVGEKAFEAKAQSRFLFAPVPAGTSERRPCCYPGQEYGILWYPFNCRTSAGLLPGAEHAAHCGVGPPGVHGAEEWSQQEVVEWLGTLGLSSEYTIAYPDTWCADGTLYDAWHVHTTAQSCSEKCTENDACQFFLWGVSSGSYRCATFGTCNTQHTYNDGDPNVYQKQQWYNDVAAAKKLDGKAIASLLRIIDESPSSFNAVMNVFGVAPEGATGDALKIMRGLVELRASR
ncbi:unnamed protein product [Prorocentrum cordatum]|uniref:Uncharacterized protein n=1 Tax=Prorocentrum cordatum TaxID=2364126 RepID=A0ABN9THI3_9DINO|nr:unnamed protein product [Polarella glacialis]